MNNFPAQESLEKDYSRVDMVLKSATSTLLFFINLSGGKYGYESSQLFISFDFPVSQIFCAGIIWSSDRLPYVSNFWKFTYCDESTTLCFILGYFPVWADSSLLNIDDSSL
ncbi:MAG: hypothetical protein V7L31_04070 [Nostoc sp.]|uniref:hypothetical protein n=1 Tax=Nostoc sp. TaxID=1180 RepID=UPI002FF22F6D